MTIALLKEAQSLVGRVEASLPSDYPRDVAMQTLSALQQT